MTIMIKQWRQQFSHWLLQRDGQRLIHLECRLLKPIMQLLTGDEALLIGDSSYFSLLAMGQYRHAYTLYPLCPTSRHDNFICGELESLPILPESMDIILLPHVLQFSSDPVHVLREAHLVLRPEGKLVIIGFNPLSLWGVCKLFVHHPPYTGQFHSPLAVREWLENLDCVVQQQESHCLLPLLNETLRRSLFLFEQFNRFFFSIFGGIYVTVAKKQVVNPLIKQPSWYEAEKALKGGVVKPARGV